jgi:hypothetical protein
VDDPLDGRIQPARTNGIEKSGFMHVISVPEAHQIFPLGTRVEIVHNKNVLNAHAVELPDHCATNESGTTSDNIHILKSP